MDFHIFFTFFVCFYNLRRDITISVLDGRTVSSPTRFSLFFCNQKGVSLFCETPFRVKIKGVLRFARSFFVSYETIPTPHPSLAKLVPPSPAGEGIGMNALFLQSSVVYIT